MSASFRIFHISDLHIHNEILADPNTFLKGLNGHNIDVWGAFRKHFIGRQKLSDADSICVVTGDLSSQGSVRGLTFAKQFILSDPASQISSEMGLQLPKEKVFIVPGNHDSYNDRLVGKNSLQNYREVFGVNDAFPMTATVAVNGRELSLIGFDSSYLRAHISPQKKLGRGIIEPEQYRLAEGFLRDKKNDFRIVYLHHNPIFPPNVKRDWNLILEDSKIFLDWVVSHKINIVMFGHVHTDFYDVLPLKSLLKLLPYKRLRVFPQLRRMQLKTNALMDYSQLEIGGKYLRQLDCLVYQYAAIQRKENPSAAALLSPSNFKKKEELENYIRNLPEYASFLSDLKNLSNQETAFIMAGTTCQYNKERINSYLEIELTNNLSKLIVYRHKYKYQTSTFETKQTTFDI